MKQAKGSPGRGRANLEAPILYPFSRALLYTGRPSRLAAVHEGFQQVSFLSEEVPWYSVSSLLICYTAVRKKSTLRGL